MSVPLRVQEVPVIGAVEHEPRPSLRVLSSPRHRTDYHRNLLLPLCIACTLLGTMSGFYFGRLHAASAPTLQLLSDISSQAKVLVQNANIERHDGFITATGHIVNRTTHPLKNIEVAVELLDAQGTTLKSEAAVVKEEFLAAGATTSFSVVGYDHERAVNYRLRVRRLTGEYLN